MAQTESDKSKKRLKWRNQLARVCGTLACKSCSWHRMSNGHRHLSNCPPSLSHSRMREREREREIDNRPTKNKTPKIQYPVLSDSRYTQRLSNKVSALSGHQAKSVPRRIQWEKIWIGYYINKVLNQVPKNRNTLIFTNRKKFWLNFREWDINFGGNPNEQSIKRGLNEAILINFETSRF